MTDSHLIPLLERVLYEEFIRFTNEYNPQAFVEPQLMAAMDPAFPTLINEAAKVRGETALEHEFQHYIAIQPEKFPEGYLLINMFFLTQKNGSKRYFADIGYATGQLIYEMPAVPSIRAILAPRFPSVKDVRTAQKLQFEAQRTGRDGSWREAKDVTDQELIDKTITEERRLVTSGDMIEILLPRWMELRKSEIDFDKLRTAGAFDSF